MTDDSERQVLGAMLTSAAAIDDATEILAGPDFRVPRHETIFDAIVAQTTAGSPVDALAIGDALGADLNGIGGQAYLHELAFGVITAANAAWHADQVRDDAMRRRVRSVGTELAQLGDNEGDPLEIVNFARARIDSLIDGQDTETDNMTAVFDAIASLDTPLGVKTPWLPLSNAISGWAPGMLYVCGARPGIGKTVFGIGALLDIARRGSAGVMISLEMPKNELYLRMLSAVGSVNGESIQHRNFSAVEHDLMAQAAHKIAELDLTVDDRSNMSLAQIRSKVRAVQRRREVGLLIVDYLGQVKPPPEAPRNDRRVQVDFIAQGLKNLARDLRVPILALAQLNREIEGRAVKRPTMADLRESGGIEAAADVVLLMHRDQDESPNELQIEIPKNRHGPQAAFTLGFEGSFSRIVERRWSPTSALGAKA